MIRLIILFLFLDTVSHSQNSVRVIFTAYSDMDSTFITKQGDLIPLRHGGVKVFFNDSLVQYVKANDTGGVAFDLDGDKLFKITYAYEGYVEQSDLINTENLPRIKRKPEFSTFQLLLKRDSLQDYSFFEFPIFKYEYNIKLKRFIRNKEYLKLMHIARGTWKKLYHKVTYQKEQEKKIIETKALQALTEQELSKQKMVKRIVIAISVLLTIVLTIIFISLRRNIKQKRIISAKHLEVQEQKHTIEEKQKEIVDSITYAKRIQRSLLPTEKYLERVLEGLQGKKPCG